MAVTAELVEEGGGFQLYKWAGLSSSSGDGVAVPVKKYRDKSVQLVGNFGSGSITIAGTLDTDIAGTYATLNDPQGNALSAISAAKVETILETVLWVKPTVTGSVTSVDVWLLIGRG